MNRLLTLLLALTSATAVLATPIPSARRASAATVAHISPYPAVPGPLVARSSSTTNSKSKDDGESEDDVPTTTYMSDQDTLDEILSAETPLSSAFLLDIPRLRSSLVEKAGAEADREDDRPEEHCAGLDLAQLAAFLAGRMYIAMAVLGACVLALASAVIRRSKKHPAGPIRLEIDPPAYDKAAPLSLSADPARGTFFTDKKSPSGAFEDVPAN